MTNIPRLQRLISTSDWNIESKLNSLSSMNNQGPKDDHGPFGDIQYFGMVTLVSVTLFCCCVFSRWSHNNENENKGKLALTIMGTICQFFENLVAQLNVRLSYILGKSKKLDNGWVYAKKLRKLENGLGWVSIGHSFSGHLTDRLAEQFCQLFLESFKLKLN